MRTAAAYGTNVPVDPEHNAIYQALLRAARMSAAHHHRIWRPVPHLTRE
jgi:1-deoxy-D-xylulose 5-phosphate reductoisomerase